MMKNNSYNLRVSLAIISLAFLVAAILPMIVSAAAAAAGSRSACAGSFAELAKREAKKDKAKIKVAEKAQRKADKARAKLDKVRQRAIKAAAASPEARRAQQVLDRAEAAMAAFDAQQGFEPGTTAGGGGADKADSPLKIAADAAGRALAAVLTMAEVEVVDNSPELRAANQAQEAADVAYANTAAGRGESNLSKYRSLAEDPQEGRRGRGLSEEQIVEEELKAECAERALAEARAKAEQKCEPKAGSYQQDPSCTGGTLTCTAQLDISPVTSSGSCARQGGRGSISCSVATANCNVTCTCDLGPVETDLCRNLPGVQLAIPAGYTWDAYICTYVAPEPVTAWPSIPFPEPVAQPVPANISTFGAPASPMTIFGKSAFDLRMDYRPPVTDGAGGTVSGSQFR